MRIVFVLVSLTLVACGGSGGGPTEAPINLTSSGASPNAITIPTGGRVHFFNKDTVDHQVASSNCPDLVSPRLTPGTDSLRPIMTGPLACTFSDALTSSASFNGTVTVNAPGTGGGGGY
jgi:plastocyanin